MSHTHKCLRMPTPSELPSLLKCPKHGQQFSAVFTTDTILVEYAGRAILDSLPIGHQLKAFVDLPCGCRKTIAAFVDEAPPEPA